MSLVPRLICAAAIVLGITYASATDAPNTPLSQAGNASVQSVSNLEFAGVTTVGNRTTITLHDKQQNSDMWLDVGKTSGDITVLKYDGDHDQVTIRRNGVEMTLPLRPPSAVVSGNTAPLPAVTPALAATPTTNATAPAVPMTQARQEEEARMLVSDLLEIGMVQRRAYEEAQRRAAAGRSAQPQSAPESTQPAAAQPVTPTSGQASPGNVGAGS